MAALAAGLSWTAVAQAQDIHVRSQWYGIKNARIARALPALNLGMNDFERWWGGDFTMKVGNAPPQSWQITLRQGTIFDPCGYHFIGPNGPYAVVYVGVCDWQLVLTHEMFEMAADPYIDRSIRGPSGLLWLVEVADPVEAFYYKRKGFRISDFVGPDWYTGGRYFDKMHLVKRAEQILPGGYASFWDGTEWSILEG